MKVRKFGKLLQFYKLVSALFLILINTGCGPAKKAVGEAPTPTLDKTLLWRISGNGMSQPSYLFGTVHVICKEEAKLSDSLRTAIRNSQGIYFEVDMDNLVEMMGAMTQMRMKNDTTLADLISKEDYQQVKDYFKKKGGIIPFSMIEKYKPLLAASTMMEEGLPCEENIAMEQVIMNEAKKSKKKIHGLETLAYQMSIFDSIPYKVQADQLVKYVLDENKNQNTTVEEFQKLLAAYKAQDLELLEKLTNQQDLGVSNFEELLLTNRNRNWVTKLKGLLKDKSYVIAVGAGHLPGKNGLIRLLREAGYRVEPVENKVGASAIPQKEI